MIDETKIGEMSKQQIIADLNRLYDEIRAMIPTYGNSMTGSVISDISQRLSKAIAKIERAEHKKLEMAVMK